MPEKGTSRPGDVWYAAPGTGIYPGENPLSSAIPPEARDQLWGQMWSRMSPEKQLEYLQQNGLNPEQFSIHMDESGNIINPSGTTVASHPEVATNAPMNPEQQKLADMKRVADAYQNRRPEVETARMNALAMQSRAYQPLQNAMATLYGGRGPSSALPNGMGPQGPQGLPPSGVRMPAPGAFGHPGMPTPGQVGGMRPPMGPRPTGMFPGPGTPIPQARPMPPPPQGSLPRGMPGPPPGPIPPPPGPPGTGVSGVTVNPQGMFNSPLPPGFSSRY